MFIGAADTGKSTYAMDMARAALDAGKTVGYVDADVAIDTIAPPACTGLRILRSVEDLDTITQADEIRFVGSTQPKHLVTQLVVSTARLAKHARAEADLILIDTTSIVSGVVGETLKYHKMELSEPELVIGLQRGSELEPLAGMLSRFFDTTVELTSAHPDVAVSPPTARSERLREALRRHLDGETERWRVRPTVFAPTLPTGLDLSRLDGVLVGVHDDLDHCLGLGVLDWDGSVLRVETKVGEGMKGLRLGSMRVDRETFAPSPVNLREVMFGL